MATRKELLLASIWVGMGAGHEINSYDLESDSDSIHACAAKWTPFAVDIVEMAYNVTMAYPDEHMRGCYHDFGEFVANWYNNDCGEPSKEEVIDWVINNTLIEFDDLLSETQHERLEALMRNAAESYNP